jgi:hypothetical protein
MFFSAKNRKGHSILPVPPWELVGRGAHDTRAYSAYLSQFKLREATQTEDIDFTARPQPCPAYFILLHPAVGSRPPAGPPIPTTDLLFLLLFPIFKLRERRDLTARQPCPALICFFPRKIAKGTRSSQFRHGSSSGGLIRRGSFFYPPTYLLFPQFKLREATQTADRRYRSHSPAAVSCSDMFFSAKNRKRSLDPPSSAMGARRAGSYDTCASSTYLPTHLTCLPEFKLREATQTEDVDLPARPPCLALIWFFFQQKSKKAARSSDRTTRSSSMGRASGSRCLSVCQSWASEILHTQM